MKILKILLSLSLLLMSQIVVAESGHHHSHHQEKGAPKLVFNHGKKWLSDQPLRSNMSAIHGHIKNNLSKIHANQLTTEEYKELGKKIKKNIDAIFKNCKLKADADAQLHIVMAGLLSANSRLMDNISIKEKKQEVEQILVNYKTYLKYFD